MFKKFSILMLMLISFCGCSTVTESAKKIIGNSMQTLNEQRRDAISATFQCAVNDCYDVALALAASSETVTPSGTQAYKPSQESLGQSASELVPSSEKPSSQTTYEIFMQNRSEGYIDVMNVIGSVDTTEVGIFFVPFGRSQTKIEISSLASSAKLKVSEILFPELERKFSRIK